MEAIIDNVVPRCGCDFREDRITDRVFQCFPSSPQAVTYHAQLHGTLRANVTQLVTAVEEWVSSVDIIAVQFLPLSVESFCEVASSSSLVECPSGATTRTTITSSGTPTITDHQSTTNSSVGVPDVKNSQSSITAPATAASVVIVVIVVACVVVITVVAVVVLRSRRSNLDLIRTSPK